MIFIRCINVAYIVNQLPDFTNQHAIAIIGMGTFLAFIGLVDLNMIIANNGRVHQYYHFVTCHYG